jgi:hypothetical protein
MWNGPQATSAGFAMVVAEQSAQPRAAVDAPIQVRRTRRLGAERAVALGLMRSKPIVERSLPLHAHKVDEPDRLEVGHVALELLEIRGRAVDLEANDVG